MTNSTRHNDHFSKLDPTDVYPEIEFGESRPSSASLMLADMPIYHSTDDAQVAMLERGDITFICSADAKAAYFHQNGLTLSSALKAAITEFDEAAKHRAWADQFGKDIIAAAKQRRGQRIG